MDKAWIVLVSRELTNVGIMEVAQSSASATSANDRQAARM